MYLPAMAIRPFANSVFGTISNGFLQQQKQCMLFLAQPRPTAKSCVDSCSVCGCSRPRGSAQEQRLFPRYKCSCSKKIKISTNIGVSVIFEILL